MIETLVLIVAFLALIGSGVATYLNLNLKVQANQDKILEIERKLVEMKEERKEEAIKLDKTFDKLWKKLEDIDKKLDEKFDIFGTSLTILKTEHENAKCIYKETKK